MWQAGDQAPVTSKEVNFSVVEQPQRSRSVRKADAQGVQEVVTARVRLIVRLLSISHDPS